MRFPCLAVIFLLVACDAAPGDVACREGAECPAATYCMQGQVDGGVGRCAEYPPECGDAPSCREPTCFAAVSAGCDQAICYAEASGDRLDCRQVDAGQ